MSNTIKSIGYTVKSGDLYLQNHNKYVFGLNPDISMTFGELSNGFELIALKSEANGIAKACGGSVIEIFVSDGEELVGNEEQN